MNNIEKLLREISVPNIEVPRFRQALRSRLIDEAWARRPALNAPFVWATALAASLALVLGLLVVKPTYAHRLHVALFGQPPAAAPGVPVTNVQPSPVELASADSALKAPLTADDFQPERLAARPPRPAVRVPDGFSERELEIVRRLAAATMSNEGNVDARPVGRVQMREYELSNGQRMTVVDEVHPKATKCVYY